MGVSLNTRAWKQSTDKDADTNTPLKNRNKLPLPCESSAVRSSREGETLPRKGSKGELLRVYLLQDCTLLQVLERVGAPTCKIKITRVFTGTALWESDFLNMPVV